MNKKGLLIVIPILLLPYFVLFALATIFFSTKLTFFNWIMESVFQGNALYIIAALLIYCLLATVLSVVCFVVSIFKKWDALSLAKIAMLVKLIQVPAYLLIFILGVLFAITIFTFPFSIGLFLIDCLSVFSTGLWAASAVIITIRQGTFKPQEVFWAIILSFIFCVDVVSSVVFYIKLKRFNS